MEYSVLNGIIYGKVIIIVFNITLWFKIIDIIINKIVILLNFWDILDLTRFLIEIFLE